MPGVLVWLGRPDALLLENRDAWVWFLANGEARLPKLMTRDFKAKTPLFSGGGAVLFTTEEIAHE